MICYYFFPIFVLLLFFDKSSSFDCTNKTDGMYPSIEDGCTDVFWKCWAQNAFRYTCPNDLYFRNDAKYCDYKGKVPECQKKNNDKKEELNFDCSNKKDGQYEEQKCHKEIFQCKKGKSTHKSTVDNS